MVQSASQLEYRAYRGRGRAGLLFNNFADRVLTRVNSAGQAAQVTNITVTAANAQTYTINVDGLTVSFLSDASATVAEILEGLRAALVADAIIFGILTPTIDGTTLVLTGRANGFAFNVSASATGAGAITVTTATSASDANFLGFGLGVIRDTNNARGVVVPSSGLIARAVELTPLAVNNATYSVGVKLGTGVEYVAQFTADGTATAEEIAVGLAAQLNALLPADTVLAGNTVGVLELTAEVAGQDFEYSLGSNNNGATWTVTSDNRSEFTSIDRALIGVTGLEDSHSARTIGDDDAGYEPNADVSVMVEGLLLVDADNASIGDPVYIGTSSTEAGQFFNASGTGRLLLGDRFYWVDPSISGRAILGVR